MRTDTPTPTGSTAARLRAEFGRARRRIAERAPAWSEGWRSRGLWPYVLGALGVVGVLALAFALGAPATPTGGFVRSGQEHSYDDLITIRKAFDAKNLPFRVDRQNRVEVAADRLDEANAVVSKLDVGPRALPEIEKTADVSNLWDTPGAKDLRIARAREEVLAAMIRKLDGITGAHVWINRPKALPGRRVAPPPAAGAVPGASPAGLNTGGGAGAGPTAFVYLDTRDGREISDLTVQSIVGLVASFEPDVRQDAVSVFDRKLRHYADARNPSIGAQTRDRARAEKLAQEIKDKLDAIQGVQVCVRLVPATPTTTGSPISTSIPAPTPMPSPALPPAPVAESFSTLPPLPDDPRAQPPGLAPAPAATEPIVGVNRPLDLAADPPSAPAAPPRPPTAPSPVEGTFDAARGSVAQGNTNAAAPASTPPMKAQVWVTVPRSFYLKATAKLMPSFDDVQPLVTRTETLINKAVRHVVPPGQLGDVDISTIPDELPAAAPPPATTDPRRAVPWWLPVVVVAGAAAAGTSAAVRMFAGRRPSPGARGTTRDDRGRYKIDKASDAGAGPGPSERVRELIRLNPEAAASVLHRWTGQGGPIA